jgi:uncharacterized protein YggE
MYGNGANPRVVAYQVANTVTAKLHAHATDWVAAGATIDSAAAAAGNAIRIQQISFSVDADGGLASLARAAAVRQAADQARDMAQAANVRLGPLCSINDATQSVQPIYATPAESAGAGAAIPLAPGTQTDSTGVTAVFAVANS